MAKDSSGKKLPWLKLWTRDLMADPFVQTLSWDRRGRYLWALMCSWDTDTPGLAPEELWAQWMGFNEEAWEAAKGDFWHLLHPCQTPAGCEDASFLLQKRLLAEYRDMCDWSDGLHARAMKGVTARTGVQATQVALRSDLSSTQVPTQVQPSSSSKESKSKTKTLVRPPASLLPRFEEFWSAYPRKTAKKPCRTKWERIGAESNDDLFLAIMSGLERAKKSEQWADPQFIPHPLTFLNQERWTDEPEGTKPDNHEPDPFWDQLREQP